MTTPDEGGINPRVPDRPILLTPDLLEEPTNRSRFDLEKDLSYFPPATLVLIIACTGVFCWQVNTDGLQTESGIIRAGALHQSSVMAGEYWRMISSLFLHGSIEHLLGNCLAMYVIGMACEHIFRSWRFLSIFILSGITGSILTVYYNSEPVVGASGAIFGLLGCLAVALYSNRNRLYFQDRRIVTVLAIWAVYMILTGLGDPCIANSGHLGGLLGGLALGIFLRPPLLVDDR